MEERVEFGREIVETYRQPDSREVTGVYSCPLPGSMMKEAETEGPINRNRRKKGLVVFLICLAVAVLLAIAAAFLADNDDGSSENREDEKKTEEITIPAHPFGQGVTLSVLREHGAALTAQEVYRQVNPAVVTVMVNVNDGMGVGTGVIFTTDGYVITNHHVLAGGVECMIATAEGYTYPASYVAGDAVNDLAILKINTEESEVFVPVFPAAEFGDSDLLTVGDKVYAIGNPLGMELRGTLTDGIVSAINRDVRVDGRTMTLIQTNAALNSGNSGGPLINEYGQVVGINVIKMTSKYNNVEGLGFAIPSMYMERIINDLLTWGELQPEPVLGIMVMQVADQPAEGITGLLVDSVTPGGAADLAGVQAGDYLLTADGDPLMTSQDLLRIRRQHYLGDEMIMTLWRNGQVMEVTLQLENAVEDAEPAEP